MLSERPTMISLHDVIQEIAPLSYDIGVKLGLDTYQLEKFQTDHPTNCVFRCQKIFEIFLKKRNPTWNEVLHSLRAIDLIVFTDDIEERLPGQAIGYYSQLVGNISL